MIILVSDKLKHKRLHIVMWSVDERDWLNVQTITDKIECILISSQNGASKQTTQEITSADISSAYCALAEVYLTDYW